MPLAKQEEEEGEARRMISFLSRRTSGSQQHRLQTARVALGCLLLLQDDPFADGGWASLGLGPSKGPDEGLAE